MINAPVAKSIGRMEHLDCHKVFRAHGDRNADFASRSFHAPSASDHARSSTSHAAFLYWAASTLGPRGVPSVIILTKACKRGNGIWHVAPIMAGCSRALWIWHTTPALDYRVSEQGIYRCHRPGIFPFVCPRLPFDLSSTRALTCSPSTRPPWRCLSTTR